MSAAGPPKGELRPLEVCTSAYADKLARLAADLAAAAGNPGGGTPCRPREDDVEPVSRPRAAARARDRPLPFQRGDRDRCGGRRRQGRGHDPLRRPGRRDARARRDAGRGAAAEIDHAGRRGRRRGHRVVVVPPRPRARRGHRARRADGRRPHRHLHARQRAPRPLPRLSEFVRHAGLRARASPPRLVAGQAVRGAGACPLPQRRCLLRRCRAALRRRPTRFSRRHRVRRRTRCTSRSAASPTRAPYASDYTFEHIYYRSIRERTQDFLRTRDYLWRWDTDWFWCSKNVGAQQPLVRRLLGRKRLNSITYQRIMRWNSRVRRQPRLGPAARRARRIGDPGRRHSARSRRRVPRLPARRHRHPPDLDLPDPGERRPPIFRSTRCARALCSSISASGTR